MLHCRWVALHVAMVHNPDRKGESRLIRHLDLARELGAEVITTSDQDVVRGLKRVARQWNITHLVLGKPAGRGLWPLLPKGDRTVRRLLNDSAGLQIHLVGPEPGPETARRRGRGALRGGSIGQYLTVAGVVALVTGAAFLLTPVVGAHATALVYLLTVVLLALFVDRGPALLAAALSALVWDYFFLPPVFAFQIHSVEDAMLFGMYFVVALVVGQLTARIKAQQTQESERQNDATALYLLTRESNQARAVNEIIARAREQMGAAFQLPVSIILAGSDAPGGSGEEAAILAWIVKNGRPAGRGANQFAGAPFLCAPITNSSGTIGAVRLEFPDARPPSLQQLSLLEACSRQIGLALDRLRLSQLSEQARALTESERLSKALLDSVSHELRTPIAAIQSAAGNLLELKGAPLSGFHRQMMEEIAEASRRLDRLVGNVLDMNRIQSGAVKPIRNECDPAELVHLCLAETEKLLASRKVRVSIQPNLPMTQMDFVLTHQALANLLSNAAAHTDAGTEVEVSLRAEADDLIFTVADHGRGIDPAALPRVFDKFYRAPNAPAGGAGLGLSLVKGFIEAQGGSVTAANRPGGGAVFAIQLPIRKAAAHAALLSRTQ